MICPECSSSDIEVAGPADVTYGENVAPAGIGIRVTCSGAKRMRVHRCRHCGNKFISGVGISGRGAAVFVVGGK